MVQLLQCRIQFLGVAGRRCDTLVNWSSSVPVKHDVAASSLPFLLFFPTLLGTREEVAAESTDDGGFTPQQLHV